MTETLIETAEMPPVTDTKPTIDAAEAKRLIRMAANLYGLDHISSAGCYVLFDGAGTGQAVGCIVGAVLHALGTPVDELDILPLPYWNNVSWKAQYDYDILPARFTDGAERVLQCAMAMNDDDISWGVIADTTDGLNYQD